MQEVIREYLEQAKAGRKKKKGRSSKVLTEKEIRELESLEIPEKIKEEVRKEVAEKMGISVKEVRELMEEFESGMPSRKLKK